MMNWQLYQQTRAVAYADLQSTPDQRVVAAAVLCMMHTGESLGTATNASAGRYGVITWRQRHFAADYTVKKVELRYVGAKGAIQVKAFEDPELFRVLHQLLRQSHPCQPVLKVSDHQVNHYLRRVTGCTARDLLKYVREVVLKTKPVPSSRAAAPKTTKQQRKQRLQQPQSQNFYLQTEAFQ